MDQPETSPADELISKHRIVGLADAVFAIAMTLLVLELRVPELPRNTSSEALLDALSELTPVAAGFLWTFILSSIFWYLHSRQFQIILRVERPMIAANLAMLMFVSLLPFSTALQGRYPSSPVAGVAYFSNMFGISLALVVNWWLALKYRVLSKPHDHPDVARLTYRLPVYPLASVAALFGTLRGPAVAAWAFLGTIVLFTLWERVRARMHPRAS